MYVKIVSNGVDELVSNSVDLCRVSEYIECVEFDI